MIKHFLLSALLSFSMGVAAQEITITVPKGYCKGPIHIVPKAENPNKPITPPTRPRPPSSVNGGTSEHVQGRVTVHQSAPGKATSHRQWRSAPTDIHSFRFKTKDTDKPFSGKAAAARISGSDTKGLLLEISRKAAGPAASNCRAFDAEAAGFTYYGNVREIPSYKVCILKPNTWYYANVYHRHVRNANKMTCKSPCSFLFQRF